MKICKKCKENLRGRRKVINGHAEYLCIECHIAKLEKSGTSSPLPFKDTISSRQSKVIARPNLAQRKAKVIPTPIIVVNKTDDTAKLLNKSSKKKEKNILPPEAEINAT